MIATTTTGTSTDTTAALHPVTVERWSPRGFDHSHPAIEENR